jgi:hypothetical protein
MMPVFTLGLALYLTGLVILYLVKEKKDYIIDRMGEERLVLIFTLGFAVFGLGILLLIMSGIGWFIFAVGFNWYTTIL